MAQRIYQLESKSYVAGGSVPVSLKDLPKKHRIKYIVLRLEAAFTTGAAAALIDGAQLFRLFGMIDMQSEGSSLFRGSGVYANFLNWCMRGGQEYLPASVPATNASTFRRTVTAVIPFYDPKAWSPADLCPNTEQFSDSALVVDFNPWTTLTNGNTLNATTGCAGTLRAFAVLDEANGQAPSDARYGYSDFTSQSPSLDAGLYTHIFAFKEDLAVITSAELSAVAASANGEQLINTARAEELAYLFDELHGSGGSFRAYSATAPVAGEQLSDEPGTGAGAAATVSLEYAPLIFPVPHYKLTQAIEATQGLRFDFTGSQSTWRLGFRKVLARNEGTAIRALQTAGTPVTRPEQIAAKTESKAPLSASKLPWTRYLPLRGKV